MANPLSTGVVDFHRRKLGGLFGLNRLNVPDISIPVAEMIRDNPALRLPMVEPHYLYGIEVEVERVRIPDNAILNWNITEDGSLRDHGYEFVSKPTHAEYIPAILHKLFNSLRPGYTFSPRCSTHIHMNVRDINIGSLYNLVLVYQLFERALFKWVGHNRDKNIFCVPLYECELPNIIRSMFEENPVTYVSMWSKYTAMNLLPITNYGTVEFRHLEGTNDIRRILSWVNMLSSMKRYAQRNNLETIRQNIFELNTTSHYLQMTEEVFGIDLARELVHASGEEQFCLDMSRCVSEIKKAWLASKRAVAPRPDRIPIPRDINDGNLDPERLQRIWATTATARAEGTTTRRTILRPPPMNPAAEITLDHIFDDIEIDDEEREGEF